MEKLKVRLPQIFCSPKSQFLIKNNGDKIPVGQVLGKNVLLFVGFSRCRKSQQLVSQLLKWQEEPNNKERKINNEPFEVVYFSLDRDEASFNDLFRKMPWPAFPWDDEVVDQILTGASEGGFIAAPNIFAFAPNGRILSLRALWILERAGVDEVEYFNDEHLLDQVRDLVAARLVYPLDHEDGNSYNKMYPNSKFLGRRKAELLGTVGREVYGGNEISSILLMSKFGCSKSKAASL